MIQNLCRKEKVSGTRRTEESNCLILSAIKLEKDRTTTEVENEFENNHSLT